MTVPGKTFDENIFFLERVAGSQRSRIVIKVNANYLRIWATVNVIPKGKVASYGQIADLAGLPGRARLAGKALRETPDDMKIPWYRVVRSNGQLAFKNGSEQARQQKEYLMNEKVTVFNNRVEMKLFNWCPNLEELVFQLKF